MNERNNPPKGIFLKDRTIGIVLASVIGLCAVSSVITLFAPEPRSAWLDCSNNLRQLAIAFHNYHEAYGTFPPAYVLNERGKRIHGWRGLLLEMMEQQSINYDLSKPWDSQDEGVAVSHVVQFICPRHAKLRPAAPPWTDYLAVAGNSTAWPGADSVSLDEIKDDHDTTLLLIEIADSSVHWADPRDIDLEKLCRGISSRKAPLASHHRAGTNALFVNGYVRFLPSECSAEAVRAMATIAGGEVIEFDEHGIARVVDDSKP